MEVLAYRTERKTHEIAQQDLRGVSIIEWLVATQYGIAHFTIRVPEGGAANPRITTQWQKMQHGWLKKEGKQGVRRHIYFNKMAFRARDAMVAFHDSEAPTIEALEEKYHLGAIFSHDEKAGNTWAMLTGKPQGGLSLEKIIAEAQVIAKEERDVILHKRAVEIAKVDDQWGMF